MSRDFEELDYQETALGPLSLRRRRIRSLDDREVYEVKLGDAFLMSSLFHEVEEALAHLALGERGAAASDVVVGGLGLGYTAAAALQSPRAQSLLVVEALAPVIRWHRQGMVPHSERLVADARCRFVHADFFALAQSPAGFDPEQPGRKFHAVLLDIDHSPANLLHPRHAPFYAQAGLVALTHQLHPGGVFAQWSDDPPDEPFLQLLKSTFATARAEVVRFDNPLLECQSASTVYLAGKAASKD
jgi:spermidine synthase